MSNKIKEEIMKFGISELRADQILELFEQTFKEILPEEKEFEKDENKYPDARWQRENYGRKKWNDCLKIIKDNLKKRFDIEI